MDLNTFTLAHILISLTGIASGFVVLGGWLAGQHNKKLNLLFLIATAATSITGFFFPITGFTPAVAMGILSLITIAVSLYSLYGRKLLGGWRTTYVITALASLYFNFFVLIAQIFQKTPALKTLAPTQTEMPFALSQGLTLIGFVVAGIAVLRRFPAGSTP